ncbi:hypothetical protein [Parabacteroides distasonis]|uniref:DUF748 domain-containing protein n=1 Tax=Parabacteroides distasonis TaxID=823 RepID=A0A4V3RPU1_PARDI|nr:hypothetical protein [Parabacteroides distasonis]TGY56350.1 hypothetical protein E5342_12280 [Parabacteroides distasonis]
MSSKIRKILKHTVIAILSLVVLFLVLNLFLTGRLERYLKKELIERTAKATDGFYRLSFDKLSISFFKGELRLEGISLEPDSMVFEHLAALDSLPDTYVSTRIEGIDFKGINLVWRWNYRQLHFNTFEIRSPEVRIYGSSESNPLASGLAVDTVEHTESKTLYEVISPYIDALSVKTLNLENASISYNVEKQVSPIIYTLNNVSFHAYGFMLDSTSSRSGKLLYCDNFDFVTNQPQTLLVNNDFRLETDSICLSTQDSIIYIQKIQLLPQELLWGETNRKPTNYLEGKVQTVEIQGIHFRREDALNHLSARNFEIQSSDIKVYDLTREKKLANADADSLVQALSLYDVISPVLHSISVDQIRIERTSLHYSLALKGQIEDFSIPEFNFHAEGLLIDSLVAPGEELNYFRSIAFEANDIQGIMRARNHRFDIKRLAMNTASGSFHMDSIWLRPLSVRSRNDYLSGCIDTVRIDGLAYDKGISADLLMIRSPRLVYYKTPSVESSDKGKSTSVNSRVDVENLLNPFLQYLSIRKIQIQNANVTLAAKKDSIRFSTPLISLAGIRIFKNSIYQIGFDRFDLSDGDFSMSWGSDTTILRTESQKDIQLALENVFVDLKKKTFQLGDLQLQTKDIDIPLDNGFYRLKIGDLDLRKSGLRLDHVHLVSPYSKMEFAYKQPKHQDWFDVKVGNVRLNDVDIPGYFSTKELRVGGLWINDVLLQNLKNRKIPVEPHIVPMIYEGLQKAPVRFKIDTASVANFSVVYEELPVKGDKPGKLYFTDMNGQFSGLTNIVSYPEQFIRLHADGNLMGSGHFTATWQLPVDSLYDRFLLDARLDSLDLLSLNEIVKPLAPAEVVSGWAQDVVFHMDASSRKGRIRLDFPYRKLKVALLKEKDGETTQKGFLSRLANLVLRDNNPAHPERKDSKLHKVDMEIVRDPYHSTFNYLWQMLRPALVESVGVSKKEQDAALKVAGFFTKVKRFFGLDKKKDKREEIDTNNKEIESLKE